MDPILGCYQEALFMFKYTLEMKDHPIMLPR